MTMTTTLADVRERVHEDDKDKWDSLVPVEQMQMRDGRLCFPCAATEGHDAGLSLTPWARGQACGRLNIPAAYFRRCPPPLQDENFNHWKQAEFAPMGKGSESEKPARTWLVRSKDATVRGVLSPRYERLDNVDLLNALLPTLKETRYQVALADLNHEALHLRLFDPGMGREVVKNDRLYVGIHIANSEVGLRAVTVDALLFRLVCTNGLIRRVVGKSLLKQRHIHIEGSRFRESLEHAIHDAATVAAGFLEQMAYARQVPLASPERAIGVLKEEWLWSETLAENIRFTLVGEDAPETLYGLVNAVTQTVQRLSMEARFDLEQKAGSLIETMQPTRAAAALRQRVLSAK